MRVVAYLRISSYGQKEKGDSLDGQKLTILNWAQNGGHEIVRWYIDEASSGFKDTKRSNYELMLHELIQEDASIDAVVVYSLSRFSRRALPFLNDDYRLSQNNIMLISATEPLSEDVDVAQFTKTVIGAMNEHYSRQNAKVVRDRLRDTALKGFFTGGPVPYGYISVPVVGKTSNNRKVLQVEGQEAEIVREIFLLSEKGVIGKPLGVKEIAKRLNEQGKKNRNTRWNRNSVHRVLTNAAYLGKYIFHSNSQNRKLAEEIIVPIPRIISDKQFSNVQEGLTSRRVVYNNDKSLRSPSLMTGTLMCSECGSRMVVTSGKSGKYKYYQCSTQVRDNPNLCKSKRIRKDVADNLIRTALVEKVFTYENISKIYEDIRIVWKNKKHEVECKSTPLCRRLNTLYSKHSKLVDYIADGTVEVDENITRCLSDYNVQIRSCESELAKVKKMSSLPFKKFSYQQLKSFISNVHKYIESADEETLKVMLLSTIKEVVIQKKTQLVFRGSNIAILDRFVNTKGGTDFSVPPFVTKWRRDRDLNPRYAINVCRFSRPVLSTTQPSLHKLSSSD